VSVLEGVNKAIIALVNAGVRNITLRLDKAAYLAAFAQAHPIAKQFHAGARPFVVWRAPDMSWQMLEVTPDIKMAVEQIWLLPEEEQGFQWHGARVECAEKLG
jgi:hypothetical protein